MSGHDDTLPDVDLSPVRASVPSYRLGRTLGAGGMGEVVLAHDLEIGRDVALKRLRSGTPDRDAIARFLREATIQARLDHPAIVPVHALGRDADNRPYFTMKCLDGTTLMASLAGTPRNKLLRAFVDVCHAIQLAHERGYVHRDLKPSNIMLGRHNEVYVLDWGIARIIGESQDHAARAPATEAEPGDATATGTLLGTPGYMSPEQARGEAVDGASDVYALGAILFEILTGATLHGGGSAALVATLDAATPRSPAQRQPDADIAPELDAICASALRFEPTKRPTARELAERIEGYLDGDRDLDHRRRLAAEHMDEARAVLASGDPSRHAAAIRAAGRAFWLDPTSNDAADLLTELATRPPRAMPPELEHELADSELADSRKRSGRAALGYLSFFLFAPMMMWLPVGDPAALAAITGAIIATVIAHAINWRVRHLPTGVFLALHFTTCVLFSRFASPFMFVPTLIAAVMIAVTNRRWVLERTWAVVAWSLAAGGTPFVAEFAGVFRPTWSYDAGHLTIVGDAFSVMSPLPLIVANVAFGMVVSLYALAINRDRHAAKLAAEVAAWQLRQLVPPSHRDVRSRDGQRPGHERHGRHGA